MVTSWHCLVSCEGGVPAGGTTNSTNHNHSSAGGGGGGGAAATASNFKRQNTVDSATIKENTARLNSRGPVKTNNIPVVLDNSESKVLLTVKYCVGGILKKLSCTGLKSYIYLTEGVSQELSLNFGTTFILKLILFLLIQELMYSASILFSCKHWFCTQMPKLLIPMTRRFLITKRQPKKISNVKKNDTIT